MFHGLVSFCNLDWFCWVFSHLPGPIEYNRCILLLDLLTGGLLYSSTCLELWCSAYWCKPPQGCTEDTANTDAISHGQLNLKTF